MMGISPTGAAEAEKRPARASLRLRVGLWNAGVIVATLTVLTGAAIYEEQRQLVRAEAANATALLDHLVHMPQFQGDIESVLSQLKLMHESLQASGRALDLVPLLQQEPRSPDAEANRVIATRTLALREGAFSLRFLSSPEGLQGTLRRSVAIHLLYGLFAMAALLGGTEWILHKSLVVPLRSLSRQIEGMRDGRGWLKKERHTDEELAGLARAVADLGPALDQQVHEWIEAERRSAVALAIRSIRARLAEPTSGDVLEEPMLGTHAHGGHARNDSEDALQTERDRFARALADEERAAFGETTDH